MQEQMKALQKRIASHVQLPGLMVKIDKSAIVQDDSDFDEAEYVLMFRMPGIEDFDMARPLDTLNLSNDAIDRIVRDLFTYLESMSRKDTEH